MVLGLIYFDGGMMEGMEFVLDEDALAGIVSSLEAFKG